ncbi:RNA polymerase sigma factor RpoD [uncultured archaeon]|nr:RNA polymerase sigma factor RpoD [uncultured archaeon]
MAARLDTCLSTVDNNQRKLIKKIEHFQSTGEVPRMQRKTSTSGSFIEEMKKIVEEAVAGGRYATEIEPFLPEKQKVMFDRLLLGERPETQVKNAKDLKKLPGFHGMSSNLYRCLKRWQNGGRFKEKAPLMLLVPTRQAVESRLQKGENLDEIKRNSRLSKTQSMILDRFVIPGGEIYGTEIGRKCSLKKATVYGAIRRLENKVLGKHVEQQYLEKYLKMSKRALRKAVKAEHARTRTDLCKKNHLLHRAARERELLDEFWPPKRPKIMRQLARELRKQLKTKSLDGIFFICSPLQRDIILKAALAAKPKQLRYFKKTHGIIKNKDFYSAIYGLIRELQERYRCGGKSRELRGLVKKINHGEMLQLRETLNPKELAVLDMRGAVGKPASLLEIGGKFNVTRERIRQIEKKLIGKLSRYLETRELPYNRPGKKTKTILLLREAVKTIRPEKMQLLRRQLDTAELAVLDRRVCNDIPDSWGRMAASLGISYSTIQKAEPILLRKLSRFIEEDNVQEEKKKEIMLAARSAILREVRRTLKENGFES